MPANRPGESEEPGGRSDASLAADLARRGVSPDVIRRIMATSGASGTPASPGAPAAPAAAAVAPHTAPEPEPFVPHPTIVLPPARATAPSDQAAVDRLMSATLLARRRGDMAEAERRARDAVDLAPGQADVLEVYGDVLQSLGRVDDALTAYDRARETDPARVSAARKHAELLLMQDNSAERFRSAAPVTNPNIPVLLSSLMPGAGHIVQGRVTAGVVLLILTVLNAGLLLLSPFGVSPAGPGNLPRVSPPLVILVVESAAVYVYALVDVLRVARARSAGGGWDV